LSKLEPTIESMGGIDVPTDKFGLLSHTIRPKYLDVAIDAGVRRGRYAYVELPKVSAPVGPTRCVWSFTGPSEDVTRLAAQSAAQFIQNVGSIHPGAIVIETEQSRIGHAGFFSQPINRPTLLAKNCSKLADDHTGTVSGPPCICQLSIIYDLCFTYNNGPSKLDAALKGWNMNGAVVPFGAERDAR
jgi:hypothetical protein